MSRLTGRPDRASIIATAALLVAVAALLASLSGLAGAAPGRVVVKRVVVPRGKVHKGEIAPGAVTAKAIAHGAVTEGKIRKGAVTARKLATGSVGQSAIAPDAVTSIALAPGSVEAGMLAPLKVVTKSIPDLDKVAHNGEWTPSNPEFAQCGPGEQLMGGGFTMANPTGGQAYWLQALPLINGETRGIMGRIEGDSGGMAAGEVAAICLK